MTPPSPSRSDRVFVSHASEDAALAAMVVGALEDEGVPCFVAPRDVVPGEEYPTALATAIDACAIFLIVFSASADASAQVCNEIERAASKGKPILLVRTDATDPAANSRAGFFLTRHHWLDASAGRFDLHLPAIVSAARQTYDRALAHRPEPAPVAARTVQRATRCIGVDVQPTRIRGCVLDLDGDGVQASGESLDTPDYVVRLDEGGSARTVLLQVQELVGRILGDHFADSRPVGIGLAAPGQVDVRAGTLKFGPNLFSARNVPFKSALSSRFKGVPVRVDNDVRCATRCEMHVGVGSEFDSFACIFVGSGVGSGAVIDRRVVYGHNFCAGEIGHMKIAPTGPPCSCGQIGCLETFIKTDAIVTRAAAKSIEWQSRGLETVLSDEPESLTPEAVLDALEAGDDAARQVATEAAEYLGVGIANYLNLVNPEAVIIAGGLMMDLFLHMVGEITESVHRNALAEVANTPIIQSAHSEVGVSLGAALLFHPQETWSF